MPWAVIIIHYPIILPQHILYKLNISWTNQRQETMAIMAKTGGLLNSMWAGDQKHIFNQHRPNIITLILCQKPRGRGGWGFSLLNPPSPSPHYLHSYMTWRIRFLLVLSHSVTIDDYHNEAYRMLSNYSAKKK